MEKRKAAANIFMEQQEMPAEERRQEQDAPAFSTVEAAAAPSPMLSGAMQATVPAAPRQARRKLNISNLKTSEELQLEKEPIQIRNTGLWFWRRIIVPPNAYVIHTRINRKGPVTVGLGLSFRYNPNKDSYLVIPAAMQTIGVVANCITKEKQGINILGYVQWQIEDFQTAYKRLDFSDRNDPLGIVNAQLREQAEAAIKDKIATMSVDEVLTDKEPVIEELTERLKLVAEGKSGKADGDRGLGIKIVTVQIREAIVCSETLWTNLQSPFRNEKQKAARISYLDMDSEIKKKEMEARRFQEVGQTETLFEIEAIKQKKQTETLELQLREQNIRSLKEQESVRERIRHQEDTTMAQMDSEERIKTGQSRIDVDGVKRELAMKTDKELIRLTEEERLAVSQKGLEEKVIGIRLELSKAEHGLETLLQENRDLLESKILEARMARERTENAVRLAMENEKNTLLLEVKKREVEIEELRQKIRNMTADNDVLSRLIEKLPEIASQMPEIKDLRILSTGTQDQGFDSLVNFVKKVLEMANLMEVNNHHQRWWLFRDRCPYRAASRRGRSVAALFPLRVPYLPGISHISESVLHLSRLYLRSIRVPRNGFPSMAFSLTPDSF